MLNLLAQAAKDKTGETWDAARDSFLANWASTHRSWDDAMSSAWERWQVGRAAAGRVGSRGRAGCKGCMCAWHTYSRRQVCWVVIVCEHLLRCLSLSRLPC